MKNKFYYILPLIILFSCSKNMQIINKKNIVLKQTFPIQNISNKNKVSDILMETHSYFTEKIVYNEIHFNGSLKKAKSDSLSPILLNKVILNWEKNYFDSSVSTNTPNQIFGNQLNLRLNDKSGGVVKNSQTNIGYIPKVFMPTNNIQNVSMYTSGEYFSGFILKPNFTFTWDKDSLNKNGVFIYLEFDSKHFGNEKYVNNSSKIFSNLIIVADNGSYKLNEKMLDGFPSNSVLGIYIGRTNVFKIKKMKGVKTPFQLLTASYCIGNFYYKSD